MDPTRLGRGSLREGSRTPAASPPKGRRTAGGTMTPASSATGPRRTGWAPCAWS